MENFNYLREKQIKNNPLNFYFVLPMKNLMKAIFKNKLYNETTKIRKYASLLFYWRTFLIILGIFSAFSLFKKNSPEKGIIFILFSVAIYFTLCFGTSPFMRNIEVRYFLPADILLLIPASYAIIIIMDSSKNYFSKMKLL